MKKEEPKKRSILKVIKSLFHNQQSRSILFLGAYAIFFVLLIVSLRSNVSKKQTDAATTSKNVSVQYKLDKIKQGNYYFSRKEVWNGQEKFFEGKTNSSRTDLIVRDNQQLIHYFLYGSIVIQEVEQGKYQVATQPYLFANLSIYKYMQSILNQATLISKTVYSEANTIYHYQISTPTLTKILDGEVTDIADTPNQIEVEVDSNQDVASIIYDISPYASFVYKQPITCQIQLTFYDYGKVENLEIPTSK